MDVFAFEDLNIVFSHPAVGSISCNGEGIGSITFARANDSSAHDVGSDGSVMTSKIRAKNGSVVIEILQTSRLAKWLINLGNFVENSSAIYTNQLNITSSTRVMARQHLAYNCSPQKLPDAAYAAQGGRRSFAYLAEQLEEVVA